MERSSSISHWHMELHEVLVGRLVQRIEGYPASRGFESSR